MKFVTVVLLAFCAGCSAFNPSAQSGRTATIRGSVREVGNEYFDIHSRSGIVVRVRFDSKTKFVARERDVSSDCLTAGTRLAVLAVSDTRSWRATKVLIVNGRCTQSDS